MNKPELETLIAKAWEVRKNAHTPYYRFPVGCALVADDGRVFTGCNVENKAGPAIFCAEVSALGAAISAGAKKFTTLVVVGPENQFVYPCGVCRQRLIEFGDDLDVYVAKKNGETEHRKLSQLLPDQMSLSK